MNKKNTALALFALFAALFALWACNVDSPTGKRPRQLQFNHIADSLRDAGFDRLEITVTGGDLDTPLRIYEGAVSPVAAKPLPDNLGDTYQVTVKAFDNEKPGLVFSKVYTIANGKAEEGGISIVPGTEPDPVETVPPPASVSINPGTLSLADGGDSSLLKATVFPEKAKQNVVWKSNNTGVATVDSNGMVRSVSVGATQITALAAADATKQSSIEVTVSKPVAVDGVDLDSATLRLYVGGPAATLKASILPASAPRLLNWETTNALVASVDAAGKVTGLTAGAASITVHYKGDKSKADFCVVTVVKDVPVLDVGADVSVDAGATVTFSPKVTQEFGGIVEFKWSLDGDTAWDEVATAVPATLSRKYTVAADVYAYFSVKDGEGNVAQAKRLIRVGSTAPLVVIDSPKNGDTVKTNPLTVSYKVNNVPVTKSVVLIEGRNRIGADTVIGGARGFDSITVFLNSKVPEVAITSPADGFVTNKTVIDVAWKVDNQAQTTLLKESLLVEGENTITRTFTNSAGTIGTKSIKVILDTKPPAVVITSPATGTITRTALIDVSWKVDNQAQTTLLTETLLVEGLNQIKREFTDLAGNKGADSVKVTLDSKAPEVAITSPLPGTYTKTALIDVAWTVDKVAQTTLLTETLLLEGENIIKREFTDAAGSKGSASVTVTLDTKAPIVAITSPVSGAAVTANPVPVIWTVDAVSQTTLTSETMSAGDGTKTITRSFTDKAGNAGTKSITVVMDLEKPKTPVMNATGTTATPTNAATVTWKWTSGGAGGNGTYRYWMNSATVPTSPAPITVTVATAAVAGLVDGSNTLYVQEGDAQGNWSPIASQAIVIDRTLPTAIVFDGGTPQSVTAAAYTVSVAVTDASSGLASVAVAGASTGDGAMALNATSGKWTKAVTLKTGLNTLIVTATDKAGNIRTGSAAVTFALPTITIKWPPDELVTNKGAFTIKYTVGSSTSEKNMVVDLDDGVHTVTVSEAGAEPKNLKVYVYSNLLFVRKLAPATGDGSSWDSAFNDVDKALTSAKGKISGTRIWISAGTYNCHSPSYSGKSKLTGGVSLYGAFPATGRPNAEANRNYDANKTILTNVSTALEGGILDLDITGHSTIDGIVFNQVKPSGQVIYVHNSATFSNCEFHSTEATGYYIYMTISIADNQVANYNRCTFSGIKVHHAILFSYRFNTNITNTSFTSNNCRYLFFLEDYGVNVATTKIEGNTPVDPAYPYPAFWIEKGTMTEGLGNDPDVPIRQARPE